jgi:hypothetical protein
MANAGDGKDGFAVAAIAAGLCGFDGFSVAVFAISALRIAELRDR